MEWESRLILIVSVFLLTACVASTQPMNEATVKPDTKIDTVKVHTDLEEELWIGKSAEELIKSKGKPILTINATLLGGPPSDGMVYEAIGDDGVNCLDTYVIDTRNDEIIKYFCR